MPYPRHQSRISQSSKSTSLSPTRSTKVTSSKSHLEFFDSQLNGFFVCYRREVFLIFVWGNKAVVEIDYSEKSNILEVQFGKAK